MPAIAAAPALTREQKLARIGSNTYATRDVFKLHSGQGAGSAAAAEMKRKYGEITLLDFPQFTRDQFAGVRHMDAWSWLFGEPDDDSMFTQMRFRNDAGEVETLRKFDPALPNARKWLDRMASNLGRTGIKCHHVSNNAPRNLSDLDPAWRRASLEVAKKWLDAGAILGIRSMRVNTGGPAHGEELPLYLATAIESFKELADYAGKRDIRLTIENHWGMSGNPTNIRIILDEVNHPYCEASPDYCNWEHEYLIDHGLRALAPYTHTTVHAKYWERWKDADLVRCTQIFEQAAFAGVYILEYETGPWDGVEGSRQLLESVLTGMV